MSCEQHVVETRSPRPAYGYGALAGVATAAGSSLWAYLEYAARARPSLLALALAGVCFGTGATVLLGFRWAFPFETVQGQRPDLPPRELPVDFGVRRGFVALLGGALTSLFAVLLLPLRSLGTRPRATLQATAWHRGVRLLTPDGAPIRPQELAFGSATPVVPESSPEDTNSTAVLVRTRGASRMRAYSRICTHAGCSVCIFRSRESQLECPCHHSVFDVADGGRIVSGPASRRLPELPLMVDDDGFLVAAGDFDGPIGPRTG